MSANEAIEEKRHGDASRETYPNQQEELEPYRPKGDPVLHPIGQQWCSCGRVPPPTHPYGIVCVQYHSIPPIGNQPRTHHPNRDGHRAVTEDTGHQGPGKVEMQHALQPMQPIHPMLQPWTVYPPSGYLPVAPLCYCGQLAPHHHPNGMVYMPYPNKPPADGQSGSDHPNHGGQHTKPLEDKGHEGTGEVEMQHALQQMQPYHLDPRTWNGYPHSGYLSVPPLCYCGNIPPHHHPNGMVYMSYPNHPPPYCHYRTEYPTRDQLPPIEDNGHRAGRSQMQSAIQQMEPIPPAPQPWSGYPHCGYLPTPPLCYCGKLPPHHHPNGMVYMPNPSRPPADGQSESAFPNHCGQHPASMEDKGHQGTGEIEMQHALPQVQPNPPEPQPWDGYPHGGYLPLPLCCCCNMPPHYHPGGVVYMPYPTLPPTDNRSTPDHATPDGQHSVSVEEKGRHGDVTSQMDHTTQPMKPNLPVPQPWRANPHSGYLPVPPLCYCGQLPPHHHPNGMVYMPYPNRPPADGQSESDHPNHCRQHPVSMEDKGQQTAGKVEMQHALQQMQPNLPQPLNGYPHYGYQPLPSLCFCCNIPPHHRPGGVVTSQMNYSTRPMEPNPPVPQPMEPNPPVSQPMEPNPPVTQPWRAYPPIGCLPVPPLPCNCCRLPPHHHPDGIVNVPYSEMPCTVGQP